MKKYLMKGFAAIAFCGAIASCSRDMESSSGSATEKIEETYSKAFVTHFAQPAQDQTWGFGNAAAGTRAIDPDKEQRAEPRGNEWAATWSVPDTLTDGQKLRAQKYFQYNQYPGGTPDPDLVDFFVQQVYDGHDDPLTKYDKTMLNDTLKYSTEEYLAASGTLWIQSGEHMDKLTAGSDNIHINNFNNGNCGVYGNVLDNGYQVNDNGEHHHADKIMLMLNTKTDCFGYWNSNGSCGHNDRYRLVSAAVIDEWIDANLGKDFGDPVVDKWNRHFIGFDFDQLPDSACYAYSGNDIKMATLNDGPHGGYQYVWDGTNVIPVNSVAGGDNYDLTSRFVNNNNPSFWGQGESLSVNNGIITYNAAKDGGLAVWFGASMDMSSYPSVVVEFAEPTEVPTKLIVQTGDASNVWATVAQSANAGVNQIEFVFVENSISNWHRGNAISQIAIQANENTTLKISRIYLKGEAGVQGYGQYLVVDNEQVPTLHSDNNLYCGETKKKDNGDFNEQDDSNTADNGIYGYHNGVLCLNLPFINKMVRDGYLPVDTKNFREWTKVGGCADGYFSDWIVTIAKANPKGDTPPPSDEGDEIAVIAEDLTIDDAIPDFDFNDVVFTVKWNKTENKVNVTLLAAGGTLPLYIGGTDGVFTDGHEVHEEFASVNPDKVILTTTMINTAPNAHNAYNTPTFEVTNFDHSATTIGEIAKSIKVAVKKYGEMIELKAPQGGVPTKIAVKTDFVTKPEYGWCDEREDIDDKYNNDGWALFKSYVKGELDDNWYTNINPKKGN